LPPLEPELPPPLPEEQEPELPPEEEGEYPAGLPDEGESLDNGVPEETEGEEEITEESGEESGEENPEDELFFPEDTTLELSPDDEESVFSDETPEDLTAGENEEGFLDLEPDSETPAEEPAVEAVLEAEDVSDEEIIPIDETPPEGEPLLEEEAAVEDEPVSEEEAPENEAVPEAPAVEALPDLQGEAISPEEPAPGEETAAVEDASGPKPDRPLETEDIARLLNHLKGLTRELPGKEIEHFLDSDVRLSLEFLIDVLQGRKGLYHDIKERLGEDSEIQEGGEHDGTLPPAEVAGTLTYLEQLASALPDRELSAAITRKANAVIAEIKQSGEIKAPAEKG
jgi:hypothetical protein